MITQKELHETFDYDALTGTFIRKGRSCSRSLKGMRVGSLHSEGYLVVTIKYRDYFLHRLAWIYTHGDIPDGLVIDHINRVRNDNRISNLRLVTRSQNQQNQRINRLNKSGYRGVYFCTTYKKWKAQVNVGSDKTKALGSFDRKEDAIAARIAGERTYKYVNIN